MPWYRDRSTWRLVVLAYLPWLAGLSLAWEIAQLPLYAIWKEAGLAQIAFAVAHCTAGDVLIGVGALLFALLFTRAGSVERWNRVYVAALLVVSAMVYTLFSEWMNTAIKASWQYSGLMPTVELGAVRIGLAPLAQWVIVPLAALYFARRRSRSA